MGSNDFWCNNCAMFHKTQVTDDAKVCCSFCGKVLCEYNCLEEVPFAKNAAGQIKSSVQGINKDEKVHSKENVKTVGATKHVVVDDSDSDESHGSNKPHDESGEELDTFSDIDDREIDTYIHSEKEKHYKKIIWEELNREYIEGQKRAKEARIPNRTTAEAARRMLVKKTLESKINYAVLDELFNESLSPKNAKKSHSGEGDRSGEGGCSGEGDRSGEGGRSGEGDRSAKGGRSGKGGTKAKR